MLLKRLWMLLAQAVTLGVAAALVYELMFAEHRPLPQPLSAPPAAQQAAPAAALAPGTRAELTIARSGKQSVVAVELGRRPAAQRKPAVSRRPRQ